MASVQGDTELAARVRRLIGGTHPIAAARVSRGETAVTSDGAPLDADFEIGSISKGVTGMLYVDALQRGEISETTALADCLSLSDAPVGAITLKSITVHRSGLPSLPKSAAPLRRTIDLWRNGTNPYGDSVEQVVEQARTVTLGKPKPQYSNFGFELLGHALAGAAGKTYPELVDERIAAPLGLEVFYAPASPDQLRAEALTGTNRRGRPQEPWTGGGIAPAGGIRATIGDLARLTQALINETAPGSAALDPVANFSGKAARIGAGWISLEHRGRVVTWHNGGTGGFRSYLGIDRKAGTGIVLLSTTSASIDRHGFDLLGELTNSATSSP